jgi:hypothetical protein
VKNKVNAARPCTEALGPARGKFCTRWSRAVLMELVIVVTDESSFGIQRCSQLPFVCPYFGNSITNRYFLNVCTTIKSRVSDSNQVD